MKSSAAIRLLMLALMATWISAKSVSEPRVPGWANEFLRLINDARQREGAQPLCLNWDLMEAANKQSAYLKSRVSHDGPDGLRQFGDRIRATGFRYRGGAENVAPAFRTAEEAFTSLWNSVKHRKNFMNPTYTLMGIGGEDESEQHKGSWVQLLAIGSRSQCIWENQKPPPEKEDKPQQMKPPQQRPQPMNAMEDNRGNKEHEDKLKQLEQRINSLARIEQALGQIPQLILARQQV